MSRRDFLEDFVGTSLWSLVPAKHRFRYRKDSNAGMKESHRLALTMGGVIDRSLDDTDGLQSSDYGSYQIFEKGDLAFKLIDLQNIKTSRVGLVPRRGIMSPAYIRLTPASDDVYPEFFYWYFYAAYIGNIFNGLGGGIRQNLSQTELLEFPVPDIPIADQVAIARFLDRETGLIDGLIEKKARFIALLKEKILTFSDACVTGRDDSQLTVKDVDIPWAPRIPKHWTVRKGKHLFEEMARPVAPDDEIITAFRDGQVCLRSKRRTEGYTFAEKEVGYQKILKGDLVIHTMDAFAGAIGVSEDDGKATGEYAVCKPRSDEAVPEYYAYLLRCMARRNYIYVLCPSVRERAPRFRFVRFAPVKLPVPPREEQLEIVDRIERATARMKNLIAQTERSIDLLREKRAALITAAVTGKIDVRRAA
ncbi:restriction endonuclease subunit S [Halovulum dunhuangense]|uniref:restriction endonuclease subunit S n=1 Tax=Halovulum dunhuangense TaxID=1505036 RepID=UPI001C0F2DBF|nr:restriction endonuclease subunit S [Halovulum dunhuangense]